MITTLIRSTVLGAAALMSLSLQSAQAQNRLTAAVPFDFAAGSAAMRAGDCEVNIQSTPALAMINCGDKSTGIALTHRVERKAPTTGASLVFKRYGDQYFLYQIWPGWGGTGRVVQQSARERELARTASLRHTVVILASR